MLPKIFIGSSKEGLAYAEAVKLGLKGYAQCCLWTESFKLSETVIDSLINRLQEIDFAIFVLTPDDLLESRGESHKTTRDNILLEIGLSIGYLGRERVYLVKPDSPLIKMPTDLSGVIIGEYEAEHDSVFSAVGNFCTLVKSNLEKYGYRLSKKAEKYGLFEEIHHVNLPVRNLNASIEFYTQKLQMREIERLPYPFPGAWLGLPCVAFFRGGY